MNFGLENETGECFLHRDMTKILLDDLNSRYNELLQRARPFDGEYELQSTRSDDGAPHVEIDNAGYHFVTTERGLELSRKTFAGAEEFLYEAISLDTFYMGVEFEFRNRDENLDCRRKIFAKQIELLALIDPEWARRREREIEEILDANPFVDK